MLRYKILDWVKQHGYDPIGCALLQKNLRYFETSYGILAYRRVLGMDITLGAPICADSDKKELVSQFLSRAKKPILNYLSKHDVNILSGIDLKCVSMGSDRWVDLPQFTQNPVPSVRGAVNKARKASLRMTEIDFDGEDSKIKNKLDEINRSFLSRAKYNKEMSFINRPFSWDADGLGRLFTLEKYDSEHQGVFGYVVLNPYFNRGRVEGYLLDIIRFDQTRLWGVWLSVVSQLASIMLQEKVKLSLGFCPLHRVDDDIEEHRGLQWQVKILSRLLRSVHYIEALTKRKNLIQGYNCNRYMLSYTTASWQPMRALLAACEVRTPALLSFELFRSISKGMRHNHQGMEPSKAKERAIS